MVKLIALLKRKTGLTRAEFKERWLIAHTRLSSGLPGLIEYRINICLDVQPGGQHAEPIYDGTAELWWESVQAMEASFASTVAAIAGADADQFCSLRIHLYTEEYSVVLGGRSVQPPERIERF
jgi:uncharacterized protein (TIGR02118 family)